MLYFSCIPLSVKNEIVQLVVWENFLSFVLGRARKTGGIGPENRKRQCQPDYNGGSCLFGLSITKATPALSGLVDAGGAQVSGIALIAGEDVRAPPVAQKIQETRRDCGVSVREVLYHLCNLLSELVVFGPVGGKAGIAGMLHQGFLGGKVFAGVGYETGQNRWGEL